MIKAKPIRPGSVNGLLKRPNSRLPDVNEFNTGTISITITTAMISERILRKTDSNRNCRISCFLSEPMVFLTPTSLARLLDRAVERFIKLMQAISSMIKAVTEKI